MNSHVILSPVSGTVEIKVNGQKAVLREGQCLITEPATLSMQTITGVRIMGTQIFRN